MSSLKRPPAGAARLNLTTIRFEPPADLQLNDLVEFPVQDRHARWFWFERPGQVVEVGDAWVDLQVVLPSPTQGLPWEVLEDLCMLTPEPTDFRLCCAVLLHPPTGQRMLHQDLLKFYQQKLKD